MAQKKWEVIKVRYCQHVNHKVALQAEVVYPADVLPDQPARILAHRCSEGVRCMITNSQACSWSGGNPNFDPFEEKGL